MLMEVVLVTVKVAGVAVLMEVVLVTMKVGGMATGTAVQTARPKAEMKVTAEGGGDGG